MDRLLLVGVANWTVVATLVALKVVLVVVVVHCRRNLIPAMLAAVFARTPGGAGAVNTRFGYLPQVADVVGVVDSPVVPARYMNTSQPVVERTALRGQRV